MDNKGQAKEISDGTQETYWELKQMSPCYFLAMALAELWLGPRDLWKFELLSDDLSVSEEIHF